jgi:hypothetical protein
VAAEDHTTVLALLDERRVNLTQARVRVVNQLHALLRDMLPGGEPLQLSTTDAASTLRAVRPVWPVEQARKELAKELPRSVAPGMRDARRAHCTQVPPQAHDPEEHEERDRGPVDAVHQAEQHADEQSPRSRPAPGTSR